jgi:phage terminase large subunit-like protein
MRGDKWTSRHFTLLNGVTYKARGAGCAVRGIVERQHRPDLIVVDDIEDDEAVQTPERREKLWRWLITALWNVGGFQGCDKIVIGTPLHNDCVLRRLSRDGWDYLRRPALEDGRPLWPGAWSLEALDLRKREIGSLAFAQEFLLQPLDEGAHPFRREWFQFYDPTAPRDGWDVVAFVDPAIGQKKGSDWFVASVVAVSHPGARLEMRLLEQWSGKLSVAQQVERIAHIARTWRPSQIGVETNAYQDSLRQLVQEHFRRTSVYAEVIPITSHAQKNVRIRKLSPAVEFGDLRFDAAQHGDLIAHMCDYPSVTHDDFEDSLAGAVEMVRRTGRLAV